MNLLNLWKPALLVSVNFFDLGHFPDHWPTSCLNIGIWVTFSRFHSNLLMDLLVSWKPEFLVSGKIFTLRHFSNDQPTTVWIWHLDALLWMFHWISLVIMLNLSESRIFVSAWIWVLDTFLVTEPIEVLHLVTLGAASENLNTFFQDFTDSHWWAIWICQNLNFWCQPVFWCQTLS